MSPMYDAGMDRHYFIDELAALKDGRMVIPVRWLENESGEVYFDVWEVKVNEQTASPMSSKNGNRITPNLQIFSKGLSTILDQEVVIVASSDLKCNLLDLEDLNLISEWCSQTIASGHVSRMPNPDHALAGGLPIYSAFIDVFGDDVSGNRSKSWNKHWNIYFTHRNLPRKLLHQQCHIHFVSTSTNATVPEQFDAIKDIIEYACYVSHVQ